MENIIKILMNFICGLLMNVKNYLKINKKILLEIFFKLNKLHRLNV